jgi:hypothetical protein
VLDTITNFDGDSYITNSNDATLGFELVTVDDFKISEIRLNLALVATHLPLLPPTLKSEAIMPTR